MMSKTDVDVTIDNIILLVFGSTTTYPVIFTEESLPVKLGETAFTPLS